MRGLYLYIRINKQDDFNKPDKKHITSSQLHGDYIKPLQGSLLNQQYWKVRVFFRCSKVFLFELFEMNHRIFGNMVYLLCMNG